MKIVLISCASQKLNSPAKACELYTSPLFKKSLAYAQILRPDNVFILSAKYFLLPLNKIIEPYNVSLNNMGVAEIRSWAKTVIHELEKKASLIDDEFIFFAGQKYRRFLLPEIKKREVPMEGLGIGKQLKFLTDRLR